MRMKRHKPQAWHYSDNGSAVLQVALSHLQSDYPESISGTACTFAIACYIQDFGPVIGKTFPEERMPDHVAVAMIRGLMSDSIRLARKYEHRKKFSPPGREA